MRTDITVHRDGIAHDLAVESPAPIAAAEVWAELAAAAGLCAAELLWHGDAPLPAAARFGCDVRSGAVLSADGPVLAAVPSVLALRQIGGPGAGRVVALGRGPLLLGRGGECDLVVDDLDVSRRHVRLELSATCAAVLDLGSTNGTFVDGRQVGRAPTPLAIGQSVRIGDCTFALCRPREAPAVVLPADDGSLRLRRPPRTSRPTPDPVVEMPARASTARPRGVQWTAALLPAAAGGGIAWATHSPQFLLFALLSPVLLLSTSIGDRLHWRRSARRSATAARHARTGAQRAIATALGAEAVRRHDTHQDPAGVARLPELPTSRLWERRSADDDFGVVRVGTAAVPSTTRVRETAAERPAGLLHGVPVTADLRDGPLGVAGPPDVLDRTARWLAGQIATAHSPARLQLALVVGPSEAAAWRWSRWCPHLTRRPADNEAAWRALGDDLAALIEARSGVRRAPGRWDGPWLVLVVDRVAGETATAPLGALLVDAAQVGVTAIFLDQDESALPAACRTVLRVDGVTGTRARLSRSADGPVEDVVLDQVDAGWAERLGRALAPFADADDAGGTALPAACGLLDVLGVPAVEAASVLARWARADGGACAEIGLSAEGPLTLDLVSDGPHLLVAGTTGAGKSELLQTLVAGLALNHPPEALNVVLIDYKGGAAFAECAALPHCAGLVTDLDGYLTERALSSMRSELRRRERLFAAAGAADLAGYRAAGGADVPRLVLVVDEFAALAEELPDFVRGLIAVAQRGRSLGVHLVLATQRPGAAVSAEIRANTSARIALRVTGAAESNDVIDAPDAAGIDRATPGRGYLRVGSALTCFQAAHPGAADRGPHRVAVAQLDEWRRPLDADGAAPRTTQLHRIVAAARDAAAASGRGAASAPWLAPLPARLSRAALTAVPSADRLDDVGAATRVPVGVVDLPERQRQEQLALDLAVPTAVLALGAGRSGRTGLLTSLALGATHSLGPDELALHVVDGAGALADLVAALPHVRTVLRPADAALAPRLFRLLAARDDEDGGAHRRTLLLVDGWDAVLGALADVDALDCADALAAALRSRSQSRLTAAITGERGVLSPRLTALADLTLAFRLADRADYAVAGLPSRHVPAHLPPGRAVRVSDGAVVQIAHAGETCDADGTRRAVEAVAERWRDVPIPADGVRLRPLPTSIRLNAVPANAVPANAVPRVPGDFVLGVGGDSARAVRFDLFAGDRRLVVAGPPRSGRSTAVRSLLGQALDAGVAVVVAAPARSPLSAFARERDVLVLGPDLAADAAPEIGSTTLLLVDDCEAFADTAAEQLLMSWAAAGDGLAVVLAGRSDDLATAYRGLGALVRRSNCGLLLRPGPIDGEILGVRLPRRAALGPPGRGVLVPDPRWGREYADGAPLEVQVASP
ncbi:FtsK/SpoIIIE domain-containing protein [uncultured Jatrophihabitans sp.]|uniref:FtsK/SpoIIIE domain-containing protein n=1 Tax=uncultured Jatrophihabitans sp. TaxID=1610747 RepID=UPI0035CBF73E